MAPVTVAILTPPGRGAVAVIRVAGRAEFPGPTAFQPANGRNWETQALSRLSYGRWGSGATAEDVVVCRTSEFAYEIQCHGGQAAVRRILDDLIRAGCEVRTAEEQAREEGEFVTVEARTQLSQVLTAQGARLLLPLAEGSLADQVRGLRQRVEEGIDLEGVLAEIERMLAWWPVARRLTTGFSVVLAGRPNVGKSSLMNALLGFSRSIVSPQPGTTRDVLQTMTAFAGWPILLSDTAGQRTTTDELEVTGIRQAQDRIAVSDLVVVVLDLSQPRQPEDEVLRERWPHAMVLANKADLPRAWSLTSDDKALPVSAHTGEGLDALQEAIIRRLIPAPPVPGTLFPVNARQVDRLKEAQDSLRAGDCMGAEKQLAALLKGE